MAKLLFLVNEDFYFWSHRMALAKAAVSSGLDVYVATHVGTHAPRIRAAGIQVVETIFSRSNLGLVLQLSAIRQLRSIFLKMRPDILHCVGLKAAIFGLIAALGLGVQLKICLLPGMGVLFTSEQKKWRLAGMVAKSLCRFLFKASSCEIIVQNSDDFSLLTRLAPSAKVHLIRGSGVDIDLYRPSLAPPKPVVISLVARMLWHKGVGEFVEAARILKREEYQFQFDLIGGLDRINPTGICQKQLQTWHEEGFINWLGHRDDIDHVWRNSHIAVLPSYREGLPKSLLEAAACGKPIITTNVPGCRETIEDGVNGLLVPVKDARALAHAIKTLALDAQLREKMGKASRQKAIECFSSHQIVQETLDIYQNSLRIVS